MTTLPKGVWFTRKRLASGEVVRYGYYRRGPGMEALGREGSPEFHERLADVLRRAPQEGRVSYLAWRYQNDSEFLALRPLTRRDYKRQLDKIKAKFGTLSTDAMASKKISDHIYRWRDEMAKTSPRQADYAISVLGAMLAWGVRRGLIDHNRAAGVKDAYRSDRSGKVWSEDQETALLAVASAPLKRAVILAIETGMSQQDLLVLPKSSRRGNVIVSKRLKNEVPVAIPVSPRLAEALDSFPSTDATTLLTRADGFPWDPKGNGLRSEFRAACETAGITDRTFHDLRGTYITRRRAMGWTAEETALTSGHKVAGEQGAQSSYVDRQVVAIANADRLWERSYGTEKDQPPQTGQQTGAATQ